MAWYTGTLVHTQNDKIFPTEFTVFLLSAASSSLSLITTKTSLRRDREQREIEVIFLTQSS